MGDSLRGRLFALEMEGHSIMRDEPKGELARYAFGFSDKKPGKMFWGIQAAMIAFIGWSMHSQVHAQVVDDLDPLHGCYTNGCTSFGTVTTDSTASGGLSHFGFNSSPGGAKGQLVITILIPNNEAEAVFPTLTGMYTGLPAAQSVVAGSFTNVGNWTSGDLTTFLGISASPPNPINAYLPNTQTFDPTATGYDVAFAAISSPNPVTLLGGGQSSTMDLDLSLTGGEYDNLLAQVFTGLPAGTIITAFLNQSDGSGWITTAQSSSLLLDVPGVNINPVIGPGAPEPSTWVMGIIGFATLGAFGWLRNGRKGVSQAA